MACVYEGAIITCDARMTVCRYLVEQNGRIVHVGDDLPESYRHLPRRQLGDKALLPAFCDTHLHFSSFALFDSTLDVRDAKDFDDLERRITAYVQERKPRLVLAFGASASSVAEGELVTRDRLDRMPVDVPVMIIKYDGHASIVNSRMLKLLPEGVRQLRGYNGETGQMFQEAYFKATDFVTGKVSLPDLLRSMLRGIDTLAQHGVGLIHTVEGVGFPLDLDVSLAKLLARGLRNPFQMRIFFQTMNIGKVRAKRLPRVGGCFETALDGCFGSRDAALREPYQGGTDTGILFHSNERVLQFVREAHDAGLQISLHAIGDAAFEQALTAYETVLAESPRTDHRHTIIHACLVTEDQLRRAAAAGLLLSVQPAFADWPLEPAAYTEALLGKARSDSLNPLRSMRTAGLILSGGSDAPCTLPRPLEAIHVACNHPNPSESLSVEEALRMYTWAGAHAAFDEQELGTLEVGKRANMVVLDRNPLAVPKEDLRTLRVEELLLAGKPYRPGQGVPSLLLRALLPHRVRC